MEQLPRSLDLGADDGLWAEHRHEIDVATKEVAEVALKAGQREQPDLRSRLELDEEIDVALGAKVGAQRRAEEPEARDVMNSTEGGEA
jgi:hypothetical protein